MQRIAIVLTVLAGLAGIALFVILSAERKGMEASKTKKEHISTVLTIVSTTSMIADAVANVGKDQVKVSALMGPGIDPHLYRASESDVSRMSKADAIYYNGLHLEGKLGDVLARMKRRGIDTVAVAEAIPEADLIRAASFDGTHDPHVWFDVNLWIKVVQSIETNLTRLDPLRANVYNANAKAYRDRLEALDRSVKEFLSKIPKDKRVLITAHDAFGYFARAYALEVKGIQGVSTATEASALDIQRLAEFIAKREIPAIFVESSVPPRVVEALRAAVQSRGFDLKIGGELFSDAMGQPGSGADTYIGMVEHNVRTIATALSVQ